MVAPPEDRPQRLQAESERLEAVYDGYAGSRRKSRAWGLEHPGTAAIRTRLLELILAAAEQELAGRGQVLDIGCGPGWWLERFRDAGVEEQRMYGVDAIRERIAKGHARLPESDLRVGDARSLPYPDGRFSLVLIVSVLSDLGSAEDVETALREAERVLGGGGLLLVYEPRMPNPVNPAVRRISKRDFVQVLGREGWSATPLTVLPPLAYRLGSSTERLYPLLARFRPLLSHRLVEYRKPVQPGSADQPKVKGGLPIEKRS